MLGDTLRGFHVWLAILIKASIIVTCDPSYTASSVQCVGCDKVNRTVIDEQVNAIGFFRGDLPGKALHVLFLADVSPSGS